VSVYDWLLFLHLAGAFIFGMATIAYWGAVVAAAKPQGGDPQSVADTITRPANFVVGAGAGIALVFGVWLAIYVDGYELWDPWILISLLLLLLAAGAGGLAGRSYVAATQRSNEEALTLRRRGMMYHTVASLAFLVILALMVYKPGA